MTHSTEQQNEILAAFKEEKYLLKCSIHGWIIGNDRKTAMEDHEECLLSNESMTNDGKYDQDDLVFYNPTVHERMKELERREITKRS